MKTIRVLALLLGLALLGAASVTGASDAAPARYDFTDPAPAHHDMSRHADGAFHISAGRFREIRRATARFHNIATAESAGYVQFKDVDAISCIDMPGMGAMGVHFVNPDLIANPAIDPTAPEALVFAPDRDGTLRLAALEYLVDRSAWDAHHGQRPQLFRGHPFDLTAAPNRYGLAPFYAQHVWAWKRNPAGNLSMWNPDVHCAWAGGVTHTHSARARIAGAGRTIAV